MKTRRSLMLIGALLVSVMLCSLSLPPQEQDRPKNLKVLPKDISHEELEAVMKGFKNALGVKCGFCHSPQKDDPKKLDFASDDNEHKATAREMMKMTKRINKKFFNGRPALSVTCYTCHNGNKEPKTQPEEVPAK